MMILENKNNRYKINTPSGFQDFDGIQKINKYRYLEFHFTNGEFIKCSLDHVFIKDGKEIKARDLKCGDYLDSHSHSYSNIKIFHIEYYEDKIELYDLLNVSNGNIFNTNSIISHNCEFLGSAGTLISGKKLKALAYSNPICEKFNNKLKVYELPLKKEEGKNEEELSNYVLIFDTAEGTGNDSSTVQVFKIDEKPYKQVATYKNNLITIRDFPLIVEKIAKLYNNALIIGENNTIGSAILNDLVYDLEYENIFFDKNFGIKMTKTTKSLGNSNLKTNIEDDLFHIVDFDTIQEFTTYIKVNNSYQADKGKHDDTVTPLVIFSFFLRNENWIDCWLDQEKEKPSKNMMDALEEELLPIGFVSNGSGINSIGSNSQPYDAYYK